MNYKEIDKECRELCKAINENLPGLRTYESCCGHGETGYHIWILGKTIESLAPLAYWLMPCHGGSGNWRFLVTTDCGMATGRFELEGPVGEQAYRQAKELAHYINEDGVNG